MRGRRRVYEFQFVAISQQKTSPAVAAAIN
jgi:hypothetical protein